MSASPATNGRVAAASTVAHVTLRPNGRRGLARAAFTDDLNAQLAELEHEAGVREQL